MLVYRLEIPVSDTLTRRQAMLGPFAGVYAVVKLWPDCDKCPYDIHSLMHIDMCLPPMILPENDNLGINTDSNQVYGFKSLEQVYNWLCTNNKSHTNAIYWLMKEGFMISTYAVECSDVSFGDSQVRFDYRNAMFKTCGDIREILRNCQEELLC